MELILILSAFIGIIIAIGCIIGVNYCVDKQNDYQYALPYGYKTDAVGITFKQFHQWYSLNKNRWILLDNYVKVIIEYSKNYRKFDNTVRICYFNSRKEWEKYKKFKKRLEAIEANNKINKTTLEILQVIQQDINVLREQSNQEIKEACDKMLEIAERLKK